MNTIDRQELKRRLIKEGYNESYGLDGILDNLLSLSERANNMLKDWLNDSIIPTFESIEGIDSIMLREKLKMKEPAIIIAYDMLLKNPKENSIHLKNLINNRKVFTPNR